MRAKRQQRGATLIYALLILLLLTLMGLSSIQGVTLQERMASNMYDRDLAFQASEAALRAAEASILANPEPLGMVDCSSTSINTCPSVPANTFQNDNTGWTNVPSEFLVNNGILIGTPQYHIQSLGVSNSISQFNQNNSANTNQYGSSPGTIDERHYRVTARNSNPGTAPDRALVVLQATIKRGI
mgnify:CR=1 FL=1